MRILLISMPYGALDRQALGLSVLKPLVRQRGHECRIEYLNFAFAALAGHENYSWMNYEAPYTAFAGDWTFTTELYGTNRERDAQYEAKILRGVWRMSDADVARIQHMKSLTGAYLDWCEAAVDWGKYDLVGFTSTFEQNIASLALAKRIKRLQPDIRTVFGGANWEGEMGAELHRQFPQVDFVCGGEADLTFPELVDRLDAGRPLDDLPGLVFRKEGQTVHTGSPRRIENLDELPEPDFSDYFRTFEEYAGGTVAAPVLLIETARGCWWGAKSHCTFCGLNGEGMAFRSKSPSRAANEILSLASRWRLNMIEAVDNIIDHRYFKTMLPELAARDRGYEIFYEVKANLTRAQIKALRQAGVKRVQPGIESLSDHVLKLMKKGVSGLRNIQVLRWCREYGVKAEWNVLHGFPGETVEDYREQLKLMRAIRHLPPPTACGPIRMDRFSPFHERPAEHHMGNLRPTGPYEFLYPFAPETMMRIAYYFDFDYEPGFAPPEESAELRAYCEEWKRSPERGDLVAALSEEDELAILDTRYRATMGAALFRGMEQSVYQFCDQPASLSRIAAHAAQRHPGTGENEVRGFLDRMCEHEWMASSGGKYASLARATPKLRNELERAVEPDWEKEPAPPPSAGREFLVLQ